MPSDEPQPSQDSPPVPIPAYEAPDPERAGSAAPTERELEQEISGGSESRGHDPYAALRYRSFRLYLSSFWIGVVGIQIQNVAVAWEVYKRTNSPMSLGLVGLAMGTPGLLLALPAGQLADLYSRRRIVMVACIVSSAVSLALASLAQFAPTWPHAIGAIYTLLVLGNIASAFGRPARSALLAQLVPPNTFSNAITWNSSMFEVSSVLGPAIGGLACGLSIPLAYLLTAAGLLSAAALVGAMPEHSIASGSDRGSVRPSIADLVVGVRFVWTSKLMLAAMTLDMFAVLLGGCTFLLPIFAKDILHVDAMGFGLLRAAPSVGAICMAMFIAHRRPFKQAGRTLLIAIVGFGLATIVFGLSRSYWLSFVALVLTGIFDNMNVVIRHTLVQLLTPDSMRGRVSAVNQVFIGSSNEIGGLESGLTAAWFGPITSVVAGGIGTILVVIGVASIWPQLRQLKSLADVKAEPMLPLSGRFEVVQSPAST